MVAEKQQLANAQRRRRPPSPEGPRDVGAYILFQTDPPEKMDPEDPDEEQELHFVAYTHRDIASRCQPAPFRLDSVYRQTLKTVVFTELPKKEFSLAFMAQVCASYNVSCAIKNCQKS